MKHSSAINTALKRIKENKSGTEHIPLEIITTNKRSEHENYEEKNIFTTQSNPLDNIPGSALTLRRFPICFWILGLIFIVFGILILVNIIIGPHKSNTIFNGFNDGKWYEYFVAVCILVIGLSFFVLAKYQTLLFDKEHNIMKINKVNLLCCQVEEWVCKLSDIKSVNIIQVGNVTNTTTAVNYKIAISYGANKRFTCFSALMKETIFYEIIKIRYFIWGTYERVEDLENEIFDNVKDNRIASLKGNRI